MRMNIGAARFAQEGHVPESEHVERGQQRCQHADKPENLAVGSLQKCSVENCVFRKESGEGEESGDGQNGCGHGPKSDWQLLSQPAHFAQVLLAANGVNHRASRHEEQCLEEGVGHQMEDGRRIRRDATAQEHIAELGDGRIGQHAFDVVLNESNGGREDGCGRADDGHDTQREGRVVKKHVRPRDHVNAGGDHGGRVDERGDRGGAFHRVGEPDIERKLRALAGRAQHQAKRDHGNHATAPAGVLAEFSSDLGERQGAEVGDEQEHPDQKAEVAYAIDNECFLACVGRRLFLEPEADEQIRGQAHALPSDEHDQGVAGQHEDGHEKQEQVQVGEVARIALVVAHVADRVDVNQEADAGDDQEHHERKLIENETEVHVQQASIDPG